MGKIFCPYSFAIPSVYWLSVARTTPSTHLNPTAIVIRFSLATDLQGYTCGSGRVLRGRYGGGIRWSNAVGSTIPGSAHQGHWRQACGNRKDPTTAYSGTVGSDR